MGWTNAKPNKYRSQKVKIHGIVFDSKKEAARYEELRLLHNAGAIQNLQRQVKFLLIPAQYGASDDDPKKKIMLERECSYIADFVYTKDGETVVEDAKGVKTPEYKIKRKLMLFVHGIKICEV